jgi:hypothetical protein
MQSGDMKMKKCNYCRENKNTYVLFFEKDNPDPVAIHLWSKKKFGLSTMIGTYLIKGLKDGSILKARYFCGECNSMLPRNKAQTQEYLTKQDSK